MRARTFASAAILVNLLFGLLASADARRVYVVVPAESTIRLHVGKAGLLKSFGHEHEVVARRVSGEIDVARGDAADGRVSLAIESASLEVLPAGEPSGDAPKVQSVMLGPKVLDVAHHPWIRFTSSSLTVTPESDGEVDVQLQGQLELRGVARAVVVPARVQISGGQLQARGSVTIRQTAFGIEPVRAAGGGVRVADEVAIQFSLVARSAP